MGKNDREGKKSLGFVGAGVCLLAVFCREPRPRDLGIEEREMVGRDADYPLDILPAHSGLKPCGRGRKDFRVGPEALILGTPSDGPAESADDSREHSARPSLRSHIRAARIARWME